MGITTDKLDKKLLEEDKASTEELVDGITENIKEMFEDNNRIEGLYLLSTILREASKSDDIGIVYEEVIQNAISVVDYAIRSLDPVKIQSVGILFKNLIPLLDEAVENVKKRSEKNSDSAFYN